MIYAFTFICRFDTRAGNYWQSSGHGLRASLFVKTIASKEATDYHSAGILMSDFVEESEAVITSYSLLCIFAKAYNIYYVYANNVLS